MSEEIKEAVDKAPEAIPDVLVSKRVRLSDRVVNFFKNKYNVLFVCILLAIFIIRLYYFFLTADQPLWWDEAEYALMAKHIAIGTATTGWLGLRETGFPIMLSIFFKIGLGEHAIRLFLVLISMGTIVFLYLLAKKLFNAKIALISIILYSFFYLELFYTYRLLVNTPAAFLVVLGMYLFWEGYTRKNLWFYSASIVIFLSGLFIYSIIFSGAAIVLLFLLLVEKKDIFKNKSFLKSLIPTGIIAVIAFAYLYITTGHLLPRLANIAGLPKEIGSPFWGNIFDYFKFLPIDLHVPLLIALVIGLSIFIEIFIGFDLIKENRNVQRSLFLLLWIAVFFTVVTYSAVMSHSEPRYLMQAYPAIFMVIAYGIYKISELISKYSSKLAIVVLIAFIISGVYFQVASANGLIMFKQDSFIEVKEAGIWLSEHTKTGEVIFSTAYPQTTYYAGRETYNPNEAKVKKDIENNITKYMPNYLLISGYEVVLLPLNEYLQESNLTVAKAYYRDNKPIVIIYEIPLK